MRRPDADADPALFAAALLTGARVAGSIDLATARQLADHVEVRGARFENGLLIIDLQREIPEAMKPRRIAINGATPSNVTQIESKAA